MVSSKAMRFVLVTPEKTVLDEPVVALQFPLYDGQMGVLPGRAPLVGRLGSGELRITTANGDRSYFVDGGFVQIKGEVVTLLTNRAIPSADLKAAQIQEQLGQISQRKAHSDFDLDAKARDQYRTRQMLALARKH